MKKRWLFLVAAGLMISGCVTRPSAESAPEAELSEVPNFYQKGEHLVCKGGNVSVARVMRALFQDDFHSVSGKWDTGMNFEDKLDIVCGQKLGTSGLVITKKKDAKGTDTAFELTSKPFDVEGGSEFIFTIVCRGNVDTRGSSGCGQDYLNRLRWLDAKGEILSETPFSYNSGRRDPKTNIVTGTIPAEAKQAVIRIGADSPNVGPADYLVYSKVSFVSVAKDARLWNSGSYVSRIFGAPEKRILSWDADTPGKSAVAFQISYAMDDEGRPAKWTPFAGPDWDTEKAFLVNGGELPEIPDGYIWFRYRALFYADGENTPVLKKVSFGELNDSGWMGEDKTPPEIRRISPALQPDPKAPIVFQISDETMVEWNTLDFKLDDVDVTRNVKRIGNILTYQHPAPIEPFKGTFSDFRHSWTKSNYSQALEFLPLDNDPEALRVTRSEPVVDSSFRLSSKMIPVVPGEKYVLTVDIRHDLPLTLSPNDKNTPIRMEWLDGSKKSLGVTRQIVGKAEGWQTIRLEATAPAEAAVAQIQIGFDTPDIADNHYFDIRHIALEGRLGAPLAVEAGPNFHTIDIQVCDASGNVARKQAFLLIDKPPMRNLVTLRDDGVVLIDKKPFFPIGLYAVWKREFNGNSFDKAFQDLKKNGFTLAHTYASARTPEFAEYMDTADKYGIKLFLASNYGANHKDCRHFLDTVVREYKHPALLSWYLADDTASHISPDEVKALHDAIHEIDPYHPTIQADPVGTPENSRYRDYVHSTDGFLPEIYPIRGDEVNGVAKVIQDMKVIQADLAAQGNPAKTIWPIIQYFDGWGGWKRFPTFAELRAMSYLCLIHGGHGITWYTYGGFHPNHGVTATPETWKNICTVATELHSLQGVFLERACKPEYTFKLLSGPEKDDLGFPSISVLYKRFNGKQYLICANSAKASVEGEFRLGEGNIVRVCFENRGLPVRDQMFRDMFEPYAVHVYEIRKFFE